MSFNQNPDKLVECPFDSNHKVVAAKLANHIVKCKRSHPELDALMETCPFNALHRFLPSAKAQHVLTCPDNRLHRLQSGPIPERLQIPVTSQKRPVVKISPQEDDWDEGIDPELLNRDLNREKSRAVQVRPVEIGPVPEKRVERSREKETMLVQIGAERVTQPLRLVEEKISVPSQQESSINSENSINENRRNLMMGRGAAFKAQGLRKI